MSAGPESRAGSESSAGNRELIVGPGETLFLEAPGAGARLEAAWGGGPLSPAGPTLTAPAAGDHWLAVAGRDGAGNLSPIRWIRLRVDGEPPRVELRTEPAPVEAGPGRPWLPPGAEVTAAAADDLAGVDRLVLAVGDDVREVTEPTATATLPRDGGEIFVRARAVDRAGNRGAESTLELAIDAAPPAGEIRADCTTAVHDAAGGVPAAGAPGVVVPPDCRIAVEVADDESGGAAWKPWIDGEDAGEPALSGPWTEGAHTVEAATVDAVGNRGRVGPFAFTADGSGPEISWRVTTGGAAGAGGETFYRPPVTVAAEATDAPAGLDRLQASTDGERYSPIDSPIEVDGDRLWLRATDRVGNVSSVEAAWRLDVEAPWIRLLTAAGEGVAAGDRVELQRGDAVRFEIRDAGAGVQASTYGLDVESPSINRGWWWAPPRDQPLPDELAFPWPGELTLEVESVDRLGNRTAARWRVVVRRQGGGS